MRLSFKWDRKSKREPNVNQSKNGIKWVIWGLIGMQVFLTVSMIFIMFVSMNNLAMLLVGLNLWVFATLLLVSKVGPIRFTNTIVRLVNHTKQIHNK